VQINAKLGSIIMTGDVEISPVVISFKGLTISTVTSAARGDASAAYSWEKNGDRTGYDGNGRGAS